MESRRVVTGPCDSVSEHIAFQQNSTNFCRLPQQVDWHATWPKVQQRMNQFRLNSSLLYRWTDTWLHCNETAVIWSRLPVVEFYPQKSWQYTSRHCIHFCTWTTYCVTNTYLIQLTEDVPLIGHDGRLSCCGNFRLHSSFQIFTVVSGGGGFVFVQLLQTAASSGTWLQCNEAFQTIPDLILSQMQISTLQPEVQVVSHVTLLHSNMWHYYASTCDTCILSYVTLTTVTLSYCHM